MERQDEGRLQTDDIASGGDERLPEREPGTGTPEPGPQSGAGGQGQAGMEPTGSGMGASHGAGAQGSGGAGGEGPAGGSSPGGGGSGYGPQSPADPHAHSGGGPTGSVEGAGALTGQGGAATAESGAAATADWTEGGAPRGGGSPTGEMATDRQEGGAGMEGRGAAGVATPAREEASGRGERATEGTRGGGTAGTTGSDGAGADSHESTPLLPDADAGEFERRWQDLQVGFVDEPQRCVQEADGLVAELMQRLADGFASERKDLEAHWAGGGEPSTEELRVALQRYRSFFNRLLKTS